MTKSNPSENPNNSWWVKLGNMLTSRRASSVYLIVIGVVGGAIFGAFVDAELWIRAVLGLFTAMIFLQMQQVHHLSNMIEDIHPKSGPTKKIIEKQAQDLKVFTHDAVSKVEDRFIAIIRTLPGLFTLVADRNLQYYLSEIGETIRSTSRQASSVMHKIVAVSLEEVMSDVQAVAKSKLVIENEPEIADPRWKAVFEPAALGQYAVATSWVLPEWWRLNVAWQGENEVAIQKGLQLARIFIVENDDEFEANIWVMREQARQGVQVSWVNADVLRHNGIEPRDILVSGCSISGFDDPDNSRKQLVDGSIFGEQILETQMEADGSKKSGYRLLSRKVELSAYPPEVTNARGIIERIYTLSKRFDDPEWWSYFFDDDYVPITKYKETTAEQEAELLINTTKLSAGMRVLDLGCAYGRMERTMEEKLGKVEVVPVECCQKLLNEAMSSVPDAFPGGGVANLDMRDIDKHYKEEFDLVISTFTSWGYFREADNQMMFNKVFAVLNKGGLFYLDIDNPSFIRGNKDLVEYQSDGHVIRRRDAVVDSEEEDRDGRRVKVARRLSQFSVVNRDGSRKSKPLVSLRIYELNELRTIASKVGFESLRALDERGHEWRDTRLPRPERMIVVMRKPQ